MEENSSWTIAAQDEPQTPTVIANDGTDGQMIRGRGALTFRIGNFFSGNDQEQMRLTETGNLGIGTSEPKATLEVAGTIRAQRFLIVRPRLAGVDKLSTDTLAADAVDVQPLVAGTGTQNQIAKWTDNAGTLGNSGITETAGGFVGIGTTSPAFQLHEKTPAGGVAFFMETVPGVDVFESMGTDPIAGPAFNFGYSGGTFGRGSGFFNARPDAGAVAHNPSLRFMTANIQRMIITNTGKVGIGTTAPEVQLDIRKTNTSDDVTLMLTSNGTTEILGRATSGSLAVPAHSILGQSLLSLSGGGHNGSAFTSARGAINIEASQNWTAGANGTRITFQTTSNGSIGTPERMRIENNGDIGIGTTNPLRHLHVKGPGDQEIGIESSDVGGQQWTLQSSRGANDGRFEIINRSFPANRFTILSTGEVGIGTNNPGQKLEVIASSSSGHIVNIQNTADTDDADGLRITLSSNSINATPGNNFITFTRDIGNVLDPPNNVGAIEGNGSGGIQLNTSGGDYAEWLPRLNPAEKIQQGEIVGLYGSRITKKTQAATQIMAVSTGPAVLGNDPGEQARGAYERVAFIGQVMVRVRGAVKAGDFIVASGLNDGTGVAVSPDCIASEQFEQVVGQAWESSADPAVKSVRTAVGLIQRDPTVGRLVDYSRKQTARIAALEARLTAFEARLDSKTTTRNLKANHRRKSSDRPRRN